MISDSAVQGLLNLIKFVTQPNIKSFLLDRRYAETGLKFLTETIVNKNASHLKRRTKKSRSRVGFLMINDADFRFLKTIPRVIRYDNGRIGKAGSLHAIGYD